MLVVRLVGLLVAIALGVCVVAWLVTGERKWLSLAWRIFKYGVFVLAFLLLLFAGEALFHAG